MMGRILITRWLLIPAILCNATVVTAMMASPNFFTEHQPDGSPITLRLRGDEKSHWKTDLEDFIVLQVDDGTYMYAIEEVDKDSIDFPNSRPKLVPSEDGVVGKINPIEYYSELGAKTIVVNTSLRSNINFTNSIVRLARHHPERLNDVISDDYYFKQIGGEIPEPKNIHEGDNYNDGERHLRKQHHETPHCQLSSEVLSPQFHRRQSTLPTSGFIKNLVVLLQFNDHDKARRDLPKHEEIEHLMETLTSIYSENSLGKLTIESTIVPEWITTTYDEAWYAEERSGTTNLHEAMREALDYLDNNNIIDFSQYDENGDGYVDSVTFLHSGYGAEHGGTDCKGQEYQNRIWTHQWQLFGDRDGNNIGPWISNRTTTTSTIERNARLGFGGRISGRNNRRDNTKVWTYQMASALRGTCGNSIAPVGHIAHEFGHGIGLPDLSSGGGNGIGGFCLMADNWGFDKTLDHPSHLSGWAKMKLGWLEPREPTFGVNTIDAAEEYSTGTQLYKIGDGDYNFPQNEYLLIEYRAKKGMDRHMPGEGLLIYHVDESPDVPGNINEGHPWQEDDWPRNGRHYRVALVQANRLFSLERAINNGGKQDFSSSDYIDYLKPSADRNMPWKGPFPNTDSYQNGTVYQTGVEVSSISSAGGSSMTFLFRGNPSPTAYSLLGVSSEEATIIDGYGNMYTTPP